MRLVLLIFLIGSVLALQAQSPFQVDPLTGRGSASLPIYSVQCGDLSDAISLDYYGGGGVKVSDDGGNAGVGWNVSLENSVVRSVRGLPDDYVGPLTGDVNDIRYGWLHGGTPRQVNDFVPTGDLNLTVCTDELNDWNLLNGFGSLVDTEPDLFSVQAPGLQFQFVFGRDKKVKVMPFQNLVVNITRNSTDSLIEKIEVINDVGKKYTFRYRNSVIQQSTKRGSTAPILYFANDFNRYQKALTYNQCWYLASVESPTGGQLTYAYDFVAKSYNYSYVRLVNNTTSNVDTTYVITRRVDSYRIKSVTGCNTRINIDWNGSLVAALTVSDLTYNQSRKYTLLYDLIPGKFNAKIKRPFLKEFNQEVNCNSYPGYKFEYYGVYFSNRKAWIPFGAPDQQDLYGYYDSTAVSGVPDLYISSGDAALDGERFRIAPATNYTLQSGGGRTVNANKSYYGTLKTIVLPSGGKTVITYEPNTYFDAVSATSLPGAGVRVKRINIVGGDPASDVAMRYTYTASKTSSRSSGKWIYAPMFAFTDGAQRVRVADNMAPEERILYFRTQVFTTGQGRTVYEFQLPGSYPETVNGDFNATLSRVARNSGLTGCSVLGNMRTGYYTYPYAPNINYSIERGKIKKKSSYTYDGRLVHQTLYNYVRTSAPTTLVSGIRFERIGDLFQYGKYNLLMTVDNMAYTVADRVVDQSDTTKYLETITTNSYDSYQALSQTSITNSNGEVITSGYAYARNYATTGTDAQSQMINGLVAANRGGTLVEAVQKNGSTVTGGSLTLFGNGFNSRIMPKELLTLGSATGYIPAAVSGTSFVYAPGYYTSGYIDAYAGTGTPTVMRDRSRNIKSVILDYNDLFPVAEVQGCDVSQMVFAGFESGITTGMSTTGTPLVVTTDFWTGRKSVSMSSGASIQQNLVRGAGSYRFSCWVKSAAATSFTVQFYNGTSWISSTVNYSAPLGTWQFVERTIDVSSVGANTSFTFKLASAGAIFVDEVLFYPQTATVLTHTYEPLNGKTSDVDSRGNAVFQEYDGMGRVQFVKNRKKDIATVYNYQYRSSLGTILTSHFTGPAPADIKTNASITLTADAPCVAGVTYSWYIDDIAQPSTSSTLTYTFSQNRDYYVRLNISSTQGTSTSEQVIHPVPVLTTSIAIASGETSTVNCRDSFVRNFTVTVTGCYDPATIVYKWYYYFTDNPNQRFYVAQMSTNTYAMDIPSNRSFRAGCDVVGQCFNGATKVYDTVIDSADKGFVWQVVSPC